MGLGDQPAATNALRLTVPDDDLPPDDDADGDAGDDDQGDGDLDGDDATGGGHAGKGKGKRDPTIGNAAPEVEDEMDERWLPYTRNEVLNFSLGNRLPKLGTSTKL